MIVDLSSPVMTGEYIEKCADAARPSSLLVIPIDEPEVANRAILQGLSQSEAAREAARVVESLHSHLSTVLDNPHSVRLFSQFASDPAFLWVRKEVYDAYRLDETFRFDCQAWLYRTLQPILAPRGIRLRSPEMQALGLQVADDCAVHLFLSKKGSLLHREGVEESRVVENIHRGRYPALSGLAGRWIGTNHVRPLF